jgi:hypothetical protein
LLNKELYYKSLLFICESLTIKPNFFFELKRIYDQDKFKYYKKAKESSLYGDLDIQKASLEREVNIKRILGIILCSEEDDALRLQLTKLIKNHFPEYYYPIKKNSTKDLYKSIKRIPETGDVILNKAIYRIPYYIIRLLYGFGLGSEIFQLLINAVENDFEYEEEWTPFTKDTESDKDTLEGIAKYGALFSNFKSCKDVIDFFDANNNDKLDKSRFSRSSKEFQEIIINTGPFIHNLFDLQHQNLERLTNTIPLDETELKEILSTIVYFDKHYTENVINKDTLLFIYYLFAIDISTFIKEFKLDKEFYRQNNQETQYLEMEHLIDQNINFGKEIADAKQKILMLQSTNNDWERKINKAKTDVEKFLHDQIKGQQSEIKRLRIELEAEKRKNEEVKVLREFVFSLESDETLEFPISNPVVIPKAKKIILVGGHENWRKKVKEKFPSLFILDGTNPNLDIATFKNADFILFHTAHMSHAVYYKVIDTVLKNNIKFDFVNGLNLDVFEAKLRSILG